MTSSRNNRCNRFGRSSCSSLDRSSSPICSTECRPKRWSPSPCSSVDDCAPPKRNYAPPGKNCAPPGTNCAPPKKRCKKWFPKRKCRSPCRPKYKWLPTGRCEVCPPTSWRYDSPCRPKCRTDCLCGPDCKCPPPCRCGTKSPSPCRKKCKSPSPCRKKCKSPSPYRKKCRSPSPCPPWRDRPCSKCHRARWNCCCERPVYRLVSTCGNFTCCANRRQEFVGLPIDHGWNPVTGWNSPQRIGWI